MTNISIKKIHNGYVVTVFSSNPDPMTPPVEYAFPSWTALTAWCAEQGFVPSEG